MIDELTVNDVVLELAGIAGELRELIELVAGETVAVPRRVLIDPVHNPWNWKSKGDVFQAVKIDNPTGEPLAVTFDGEQGATTGNAGADELVPAYSGRVIVRPFTALSIGYDPAVVPASATLYVTIYQRQLQPATYSLGGSSSGTSSGAATVTAVPAAAATTQLLASNAARKGAMIFNDSTATLFVKLGPNAATNDFSVSLNQGDYFEPPADYTGIVTGIWSTAVGQARVTDLA